MDMVLEKLKLVPHEPGCYLMKNSDGVIIYVGKAKDLRNRLNSYFHSSHTGKTAKLVSEIADFDYIVVSSETESLILEINLIKKHDPKYNILLRDDKSYPYIELTMEKVPRLQIVRNVHRKKKKTRLFGPYPNVTAAKEVVNLLNRLYPLRKCRTYQKRPCLYFHIGQCLGYCTNNVDVKKVKDMENEIVRFLKGDDKVVTDKIKSEIEIESKNLRYEKALELKNMLDNISAVMVKQKIETNDNVDRDVFGYYNDGIYLSVFIFFIRGSKIAGHHHQIIPLIDEEGEELTRYIAKFYENGVLPREILIPDIADEKLLNDYFECHIKVPERGVKKKLVLMANENAKKQLEDQIELINKNEKMTSDANEELRRVLNLDRLDRIELFDNAHLFGTYNVSGMVVFKDGKPAKNEYRKFKISFDKNDDYSTMKEVIYRRYFRVLMDDLTRPDLIIVDGGIGQMNVAKEILDGLNLNINLVGLRKDDKHSTEALVTFEKEISIEKRSNLFHYLERMQDEVHNYTINYHRQIRSKGLYASILDNVEGIGTKRKEALLKKFKTVNKLRECSIEELSEVVPRDVAVNIKEILEEEK